MGPDMKSAVRLALSKGLTKRDEQLGTFGLHPMLQGGLDFVFLPLPNNQRSGRGCAMTYPMMQHIPLESAYLCQDCDCIGNCAEQCPACASSVLLNLASVLDRGAAVEEMRGVAYSKYPAIVELGTMVA
jgi:hypothetical protein